MQESAAWALGYIARHTKEPLAHRSLLLLLVILIILIMIILLLLLLLLLLIIIIIIIIILIMLMMILITCTKTNNNDNNSNDTEWYEFGSSWLAKAPVAHVLHNHVTILSVCCMFNYSV